MNEEMRQFWMTSLFDQLYALPREQRATAKWRMNRHTMNLIRQLDASPPYWGPPDFSRRPELLLGLPIDLDESAEGAVLHAAEVCPV
jgi:HK97 family phage major capsid protein